MNKIITFLLAVFMSIPLFAGVNMGFTNETVSKNNTFRLGSATDQRLAVRFSKEKLSTLKGHTISAVRVAFGSKQSTDNKATLFLATSLDAEPLLAQDVTITGSSKFIEYALDNPYTITGEEESLYVGYKMEIAASYGAFSSDFSGDFRNIAFAYGSGGWQDLYGKGYGAPNIEIVVDDADICDLMLKPHDEDGFFKVGQSFGRSYELFNYGTCSISGLEVVASMDGTSETFFFDDEIAPKSTYTVNLDQILPKQSGAQLFTINILNKNFEDADIDDNEVSASVFVYPEDCQKNILVEGFTGQTCTNCPYGHESMDNAAALSEYPVIQLWHHAGYVSDVFTMKEDWDLTSLYNSSTYAPAAMANRKVVDGTTSPVFDPWSTSNDKANIASACNDRPYVAIALRSSFDEATREVTFKADVTACEEMPGSDIRYSLWLVQDSIVRSQAGATTNYVHNDVSRGCLTESVWGDKADFRVGETTTIEKSFVLADTIISTSPNKNDESCHIPVVVKNMRLVFFVNQYSKTDINGCRVFNCAYVSVLGDDSTDGIEEVSGNEGFASATAKANCKYLHNGKLVIIRDGSTYNSLGVKIK